MPKWKEIKGYEGIYKISDSGFVKRVCKYKSTFSGRILKSYKMKTGYIGIRLCKLGKAKNFLFHRLMAEAFIDNPFNKKLVNHKDCNKENNGLENLEWVDLSENTRHGLINNRYGHNKGELNGHARLTCAIVKEIRHRYYAGNITQRSLAILYKVSNQTINELVKRKTWRHV